MDTLDVLGGKGKIAVAGFLLFLAAWGLLTAFHIDSDFVKFIASTVTTLWSIVLFTIDPHKTDSSAAPDTPAIEAGSLPQPVKEN